MEPIKYQSIEDHKRTSNIVLLATLISFFYCCYVFYLNFYYTQSIINDIIKQVHKTFDTQTYLILKFTPLFFVGCILLIWTTTKTISEKNKHLSTYFSSISFIFYVFLSVVEIFYFSNYFTFSLSVFFFLFGLYHLLEAKKMVAIDLKQDRRNVLESQFDQLRDKVDTKYSVNIPYRYHYQGAEQTSWINVVNPFRGSLVGGTPGSGKSYAIIEEYMRQMTMKGFSGLIYDFKFPILSKKQFNYLNWYKDNYKVKPKFYLINFDDPSFSNRCNPVNRDILKTMADAEESTKILMFNINKTWIEKEGDFFTDSANVYTSMLLWYLKLVTEKYNYDVCTLPHLIALSTFESTEIMFFILNKYSDLKPKMKPFSEALEKGAMEQLAGQVASAGVALSKIASPEIFYILSGNDFSFELNDPYSPKILCIGNNDQKKDTYSAPLGLIMGTIMKKMNQIRLVQLDGQIEKVENNPSFFIIDEFPTVFLRGVDNLIATARSNKIAVLLGFQSFAQAIADYSKNIADKISRICGTRIAGQLMDEDAELMSKSIGKQKILTKSYNYSSSDVSKNEQTQLQEIVPPEMIAQFSQGTFTGVIADDFEYKDDNKVVYGEVIADVELKSHDENLDLQEVSNFTPEDFDEIHENFLSHHKEFISLFLHHVKELSLDTLSYNRNSIEQLKTFFYKDLKNIYEINKKHSFDSLFESFFAVLDLEDFTNKTLKLKLKEKNDTISLHSVLENTLSDCIKNGIIQNNKNKILKDYTHSIYNDVYRIIMLEIIDLNLIKEMIDNNPKNEVMLTKLFTKISTNEQIQAENIKDTYKELLNTIESLTIQTPTES